MRKISLWMIKRSSRSTNIKNNNMDSDLSIEEIYEKSKNLTRRSLNFRNIGISISFTTFVGIDILHDVLKHTSGFLTSSIFMVLAWICIFSVPSTYLEDKLVKEGRKYSDMMQRRVDSLGIRTMPTLINILHSMVNCELTQSDYLIVSNLAVFLPQMGKEDFERLSTQNKYLLYSLVDPTSEYAKQLNFNKRNRLYMFAALLFTPAIDALGNMGGEDAKSILYKKLDQNTNPLLQSRILQAIHICHPRMEIVDFVNSVTENPSIKDSNLDSGISFPSSIFSLRRKSFGLIVATYLTGMVISFELLTHTFLHSSPWYSILVGLPPILIANMISTSIYDTVQKIAQNKSFQTLLNSPSSLEDILHTHPMHIFPNVPSRMDLYSQLISEIVRYENFDGVHTLESFQIKRLNFIINCYTDNLKYNLLSHAPNLSIRHIIQVIGRVGNSDSLRSLSRLRKLCNDPELAQMMDMSIQALEERLKVSTVELLRPSNPTGDSLLKPSHSDEGTGHLLKLPTSGLVLSSTDEKGIEEIQISQKQ